MTQPTQDKRIYTLSQERPAKAVVKMGVPLTCGMLIMVLYNLTDTFFIGMLRDDYQLAAVNLAYPGTSPWCSRSPAPPVPPVPGAPAYRLPEDAWGRKMKRRRIIP